MAGSKAGEIARKQYGRRPRLRYRALEIVRVRRARLRLENGVTAEENVLDRTLGGRSQAENDRHPLHL